MAGDGAGSGGTCGDLGDERGRGKTGRAPGARGAGALGVPGGSGAPGVPGGCCPGCSRAAAGSWEPRGTGPVRTVRRGSGGGGPLPRSGTPWAAASPRSPAPGAALSGGSSEEKGFVGCCILPPAPVARPSALQHGRNQCWVHAFYRHDESFPAKMHRPITERAPSGALTCGAAQRATGPKGPGPGRRPSDTGPNDTGPNDTGPKDAESRDAGAACC